jgi:hypothetical protein
MATPEASVDTEDAKVKDLTGAGAWASLGLFTPEGKQL